MTVESSNTGLVADFFVPNDVDVLHGLSSYVRIWLKFKFDSIILKEPHVSGLAITQ